MRLTSCKVKSSWVFDTPVSSLRRETGATLGAQAIICRVHVVPASGSIARYGAAAR